MVIQILILFTILLFFLAALMLIAALRFARPIPDYPVIDLEDVDGDLVAEHLSEVIRCRTIAAEELTGTQRDEYFSLHRALLKQFPRVHTTLEVRSSQDLSLLYIWPGRNPKLPGVLLSGHYDVPPVDPRSVENWEVQPFSGQVKDGFVWGRGALQGKGQMVAILQAVEIMLRAGYIPERTVYLAFGHDCLSGGKMGACRTAAYLKKANVRLEVVLDEGDWISGDYLPGMSGSAALIGVTERGHIRFDFTTQNTRRSDNKLDILAHALASLSDNPLPASLKEIRETYSGLVGAIGYTQQVVFANTWLLSSIARRIIMKHPEAQMRSTTQFVPVRFSGSLENAHAEVDVFLMPGETIAAVSDHIRRSVKDERVLFQAQAERAWEAPLPAYTTSPAYQTIERAILEVYQGIPITPVVQPWPGDARFYTSVCRNVFRFTPLEIPPEDDLQPDGANERIRITSLVKMTRFYIRLLQIWGVSTIH
ncbi:MAG: M20/M25/M40 family metallo-hydrolase [Leptolinea sp.]|jgi:carboxypeptidase PM20D1|nr:M20/M25/M40 family metallo-hydrolase [Leptolinea sp.]